MKIPVIRGVIDRRILVNYRVDPDVLVGILPRVFRPMTIRGAAVAGICLIRLADVRPKFFPSGMGISSENAAHRFAVEWDAPEGIKSGVYIQRRDTSSWLNSWAGGRLFPGHHYHTRFLVSESSDRYSVAARSDDGVIDISIEAQLADRLPETSIFHSLEEASSFFEKGSIGYSAMSNPHRFDGMELRCAGWKVDALNVTQVRSSVFDNPFVFPNGSIEFDSALLMRGIPHEWHGMPDLCCQDTEALI